MLPTTFHTDEFKVFPVADNDVISKKESEGNVMTAIQGEFLPLKLIEEFPQLIRFLVFKLLMPCHNSPFHKPKKSHPRKYFQGRLFHDFSIVVKKPSSGP